MVAIQTILCVLGLAALEGLANPIGMDSDVLAVSDG